MCVVCILWEKQKLTKHEALQALFELVQNKNEDETHLQIAYAKIEEDNAKDGTS